MRSWKDDSRCETNPLFNDNRFKLGLFGLNSGDQIKTLAPDRYIADWDRSDVAMAGADRLGLEVMVSLMGWLGTPELEPFTWAAGLGARHPGPAVISTLHMQLMHPTFVAKAAATADLITKGRFGLNVVAGFNPKTFQSFGAQLEDHDTRYAHSAEFMELLNRLWTAEEPFDFEGRFYKITKVLSTPKPVQSLPPIMNAGTSGRGRAFACKYADLVFTLLQPDLDDARTQIADYKSYARDEFGRDVQVWTHGYIVLRETEKDAQAFLRHYAEDHADHESITKWLKALGAAAETDDPEKLKKIHGHWAAGNGTRLVGTADQVADTMATLSKIGLDGILWNTIEPETLLGHVGRDLLPRLEAIGLRNPVPQLRVAAA